MNRFRLPAIVLVILYASCGYHAAGHSDLLPKTIQTICIPPFSNITTRYKLTDRLAEEISRELIARTRYRIVSDPSLADAVLRGAVVSYTSNPTVFDLKSGRASAVDVHVYLRASLVERSTGKVLFDRPNFEARERYEISVNAATYFDESDAGLNRIARQVAQQLVTSILENF